MLSKSVAAEHHGAPRTEHCRKGAITLNASLSPEQRSQNARRAALVLHSVKDRNGKSLNNVKVNHRRWHGERDAPGCSLCT
jgi:hypothetical protein